MTTNANKCFAGNLASKEVEVERKCEGSRKERGQGGNLLARRWREELVAKLGAGRARDPGNHKLFSIFQKSLRQNGDSNNVANF